MGYGQAKPDGNFKIRDCVPVTYLWIDANIEGPQNQIYLNHFKNSFKIIPFSKIKQMQTRVQTSGSNQRLRIICAASLQPEDYKYIQDSELIERAMLFCGNQVRANQLIISNPKIKTACFKYTSVISKVQQWERELDETIIFFNREDITRLNKNTANWLGLTSKDISQPEKAKMDFDIFINQICKKQEYLANVQSFMNKLKITSSSQKVSSLILQQSLTASCFITKINLLLSCTTSPITLRKIHFPVHNLFNSIYNYFSGSAAHSFKCKTVINFTDEDRRKLKTANNQILTFSIFVVGKECQASDKADGATAEDDIQVVIHVPDQKKEICTGYYKIEKRVIFNLGNFFQVKDYSQKQKKLILELVYFNKLIDVNVAPLKASIYLNQLYMKKQQTEMEGQWKSLILSGMYAEAEQQINKKIQNERKSNNTEQVVKLCIRKIGMYIDQEKSHAQIDRCFKDLMKENNHLDLILIASVEYYVTTNNDDMMEEIIRTIHRKPKLLEICAENNEKKLKIQIILKLNALYDKYSKDQPEKSISELSQIERLVKRNNEGMISSVYTFLLICKINYYKKLNKYEEAIRTIDSFLWIYEICEGRNTRIFNKMNRLKLKIIQTKDQNENNREMEKKRNLFSSAVPLEVLFANDAPLYLELNGLNFTNSS